MIHASRYALLANLILFGCAAGGPYQPVPPRLPVRLEVQMNQMNLKDGVDESEAAVLAEAYYLRYHGLCGGMDRMRRRGKVWHVGTLNGPAGVDGADIHVGAEDGILSQRKHPTVRFPWSELREHLRVYGEGAQAK